MDQNPNPINANDNSPGIVPPPYVPPLYEDAFPFYQPENAYSPVEVETHQGDTVYTPNSLNWYDPAYVLEPTDLAAVTNYPTNYLLNNSIMDTTANADQTSIIANSENLIPTTFFQCYKCPAKFYSSQAFGGHMSTHAKQAKKLANMSQTNMAKVDRGKKILSTSAITEGGNSSEAAIPKKRGRNKGKMVLIDEPKAKKQTE